MRDLFLRVAAAVFIICGFVTATQAQQPSLQITSPATGTLVIVPVATGQSTLTITVSADPSIQDIAIFSDFPLPGGQPTSTPNQFTVTVPNTISPRTYNIVAVGAAAGALVMSAPVAIDVERQDDPVDFVAEPLSLWFDAIGGRLSIIATGTFLDGTVLDMTRSSRVSYTPQDPTIVTVSSEGLATAVAPGKTVILVEAVPAGVTLPATYFPIDVEVPQPTMSALSPSSGPAGTPVTISGDYFGGTQGASTVTFGGISSTPTLWSGTSITVPVPAVIPTGVSNVVVNVNGSIPSNALPFNVTPGTAGPDFGLSASPVFQTVNDGGSVSFTISTSALQGFTDSVSLNVTDLPAGANASFSPASISGAGTSTLTINTTNSTNDGRFTLTVAGTDVTLGLTHTVPISLIVNGPPDFRFSASPASQVVAGLSQTLPQRPVGNANLCRRRRASHQGSSNHLQLWLFCC